MEEVQAVMGVPEWFLYTDSRETKSLYGDKCIQASRHFLDTLGTSTDNLIRPDPDPV